jgi:hypothetical protein
LLKYKLTPEKPYEPLIKLSNLKIKPLAGANVINTVRIFLLTNIASFIAETISISGKNAAKIRPILGETLDFSQGYRQDTKTS